MCPDNQGSVPLLETSTLSPVDWGVDLRLVERLRAEGAGILLPYFTYERWRVPHSSCHSLVPTAPKQSCRSGNRGRIKIVGTSQITVRVVQR